MKKLLLVFVAAVSFILTTASAVTLTISVSDYSFAPNGTNPATVTINLGDTVRWVYVNGVHTTTSSTVPSGAATWDAPITSSSTFYSYVPSKVGTYNYVCTPHATMGMTGRFIVVCSAGGPTAPVITSSNGNTACQGSSVNMSVTPQPGATYQWYFGTTALANTTPNLGATIPGAYTVKVSRCGSELTSAPFNVTINPNPAPSFTHTHTGLSYVFTNTTVPASGNTYLWTFSDGSPDQITTNAARTFATPGVYTVTLKATITATTCNATTAPVTINAGLGVGQIAGESYAVAPNPATDLIIVTTGSAAKLLLTDLNGKSVTIPVSGAGKEQRLDVSALPAGVYLLHISTKKGSVVEKISIFE